MKHLIFGLRLGLWLSLLLSSNMSLARAETVFSKSDRKLGEIMVEVNFVGEPVYDAYAMTVKFKCADRRITKNALKPKIETASSWSICALSPKASTYVTSTTVLSVYYMNAKTDFGEATCSESMGRDFDLAELCKSWGNF